MKPALIVNENFPVPALLKLHADRPAAWMLSLLDNPADAAGYMVVKRLSVLFIEKGNLARP